MNNHIHLILQPTTKEGLQKALKPLYMRYSQYINKQQNITGILWQGRFFSSPLDEQYTYYGFAYVENNPVKAKMVERMQLIINIQVQCVTLGLLTIAL
ncbi:hypothetical protein BSPWISOXPB_6438 [uncultured Gammaproteobacteria bacterium]|nr:hypothetical protein BSPWISOXPB_6438 [uncultured Gammaproteobacteria bacterium]